MQKVAIVNSTTVTLKKLRTDRAWFSRLLQQYGQETKRVYSFNPGACTGSSKTRALRQHLH